jgi:hypothetical protein
LETAFSNHPAPIGPGLAALQTAIQAFEFAAAAQACRALLAVLSEPVEAKPL